MKKLLLSLIIALSAIVLTSCGNNNANSATGAGDSSANVTKPSSNSDATNPSVADTAYSKNNIDTLHKDSSKIKK